MNVSTGDVKVYTVNGSETRALPDWLARKNKRKLKDDASYQNRVDLIQDFSFPEASNCVKVTRDGKFAMATGTYKPQMRIYEFAEMTVKFDRHTTAENVKFEILSDDWTKSVHLQADRSIEFHSQNGCLYSTRIPHYGRDLAYHYPSCDTYIASSSNSLYRLNLDQGRFLNPLDVSSARDSVNCVQINPAHQLIACATDKGTVELFDPRKKRRLAILDTNIPNEQYGLSALSFRQDGLKFAVGTTTGYSIVYDLRSPKPLLRRDQGYGLAMKSLHFLDMSENLLSADSKIIKIWNHNTAQPIVNVEPPVKIHAVEPIPSSGLIFVANDGIPMHTYFIPQLGPAPAWCSFLDNLTEEMADSNAGQSIYDNYRFVTKAELESLGLARIISTPAVRGYMHGFFIDQKLYEQAKLIANPFAYAEHRKKVIQEKINKERESRIRGKGKTVKVNQMLAERLDARAQRKGKEAEGLADARFANAFEDADFAIDEKTIEFSQLNPTQPTRRTAAEESEEERANAVSDDMLDEDSESEVEEQKPLQMRADQRSSKSRPVNSKDSENPFIPSSRKAKPTARGPDRQGVKKFGARKQQTNGAREGQDLQKPPARRSASGNAFRRLGRR